MRESNRIFMPDFTGPIFLAADNLNAPFKPTQAGRRRSPFPCTLFMWAPFE